ncbi:MULTISPECIES: 2Fe-2S iron-sulfur cluster-binding protein [unclassified Paenibacillus]|uniref:2Fe-2S iron-sulfur cluster-binding protein n=1 Tax=unclassified Paenibacillus TaxID=185978 RepID=UPI001C117F19|nr:MULTISPECIES: 2Fe-2S iron-sulfur cluster-binding protein [unclassified Paenibacillus]MBU5443954.1 2Fe-2S iron-sulfur cluster binding domain-containing protein [Paenibacillus sp. MSJ-34]CAH0118734.1 Na(+)-translocating NADH-quinone reductase subunit F [Paenibacillus sp. CECT 9249]
MPIQVTFLPDRKTVQVRPGTTLLAAARRARVNVRTRCGGNASCLMCKVRVGSGEGLTPPLKQESLKLGRLIEQGYRLACQACVTGNVAVTVPEDPLKEAVRKQLARQKEEDDL